eukprot:scaffold18_cov238-Chaetoceros_neogracile.AAC.1
MPGTKTIILKKKTSNARLGLSFSSGDDGVRIVDISPNSAAADADMNTGDKVLSINGKNVNDMSSKNAAALLRKSTGAIVIVIEQQNDDDKDVEAVPLIEGTRDKESSIINDHAINQSMSGKLGGVILLVQAVAAAVIFLLFSYGRPEDFTTQQYIIFRDIMVMLLLGFGYLMTFLEKYGLSAVGLTMLITVLNMECNLIIENLITGNFSISMESLINAEFSAATLLISFGALIGRATPLQMCLIAIAESFFYAVNKVFFVFGIFNAEDVGVGTTLLWVYWPSFVGATETGVDENEMHCLINTIMSLIGSTGAAFYLSQYLNDGKFDAVHIQNSTLAGGVAIGATARLAMGPGMAFIVGLAAGSVSVLGYFYSSPYLEEKYGLYDTCGVANLHGYPSVLGGLLSIFLVATDSNADFLVYGIGTQSVIQALAVAATIVSAIVSGYITGHAVLCNPTFFADVPDYEDAVWWIGES